MVDSNRSPSPNDDWIDLSVTNNDNNNRDQQNILTLITTTKEKPIILKYTVFMSNNNNNNNKNNNQQENNKSCSCPVPSCDIDSLVIKINKLEKNLQSQKLINIFFFFLIIFKFY
jgi:hypothetical protein